MVPPLCALDGAAAGTRSCDSFRRLRSPAPCSGWDPPRCGNARHKIDDLHDDGRPHDDHHLPPGGHTGGQVGPQGRGGGETLGSVHVAGKITRGKRTILLDLLVNGDGEGGGEFIQEGNLIKIERVGPLLYFKAPAKFWARHATAAQTKTYGGKWIEFSAVDSRFTSFDQFLDAADLVVATSEGHTSPLTLGRRTTFAGHKVVVVKDTVVNHGKRSTGQMYIAAKGTAYVYKIVDNTPGNVSTVVFDHYAKGVMLTVPPNAINLS